MVRKGKCKNNNFLFGLSDHFASCRAFLIAFCGAVLVGILVGCFSFVKFNKVFDFSGFSFLDASVFFSKVNFFSYACKNLLKFLILILLILIFSTNVYTFPLNLFSVGYLGYLLGANIVLMIIVLGFTGTICMIFIYFPLNFCSCFLVVNFACICEKNCFDNHKYGKLACSNKGFFSSVIFSAIFVLLLIFILLLVEGLILPTSIKNILLKL